MYLFSGIVGPYDHFDKRASHGEDRSGMVIAVATSFSILSVLVVSLRFYVRLAILRSPGWDDFLLLLATICSMVLAAVIVRQAHYGLGKHTWDLTPSMASKSAMYWLFGSIFYTLTLGLTKISLVVQYLRIFSATRATRLACICALCFLSVALIQASFFSIFLCVPVSFFWTRREPGRCLDVQKLYMAQGILNVFSDLVVITLPIPAFRSLNISRKEKFALIGIFALGSFGCVTSIVRLQYVISFTELVDLSWTAVDVNVWSGCEAFVAITCAALPVLRTLVQRVFPRLLRSTRAESARSSQPGAGVLVVGQSGQPGKERIPLSSMSGERAGGKDGQVLMGVTTNCSGDAEGGWGEERRERSAEVRSFSGSERVLFAGV